MSDLLQMLKRYRTRKIALYGLGTETERVLLELGEQFTIVGLLDGYRQSGSLYGTAILSLDQAVAEGVALILVVARPGSCKAIAKRIGKICKEHQIDLLDIRGRDLCDTNRVVYDFKGVRGYTKREFLQTAASYDVISVDLFDTLLMRQTLFPADVFEIADYKWREQGVVIEQFCEKRLESEKALSGAVAPTLAEIYARVVENASAGTIEPQEMAKMEWSIDYDLLVPRRELCEAVSSLYQSGKEVYIVTDTYYSETQIKKMLDKCGIDFYTECIVSCRYRTGKTQGLFGVLKERIGNRTCLHIGDDPVADVEAAQKNGIASCRIYSGIDLLEMTGYLGLWDAIETLSDRIRAGMLAARLFNSPFQFEEDGQKICVRRAHDLGYLFFAPMICDFVIWFERQVRMAKIPNVWFGARDGYLVKKLYDAWAGEASSVYFLTSRIAAIRAGVENESDIRYVGEMKFSGSLQQQILERFGITVAAGGEHQTLCDYKAQILQQTAIDRENYKRYIDTLEVREGPIAFFDFVAKGTGQMYIGRLVENPLKGFYFLQLEEEHMRAKALDIVPFYRNEEKDTSAIFDNYYILETVLTSPDAMVLGFDGQGVPYYGRETRAESDIACLMDAQSGILSYFESYTGICPREAVTVNKKLDEIMLALLGGVQVVDHDFLRLKVEDPFFNRMTDIADLI